MRVVPANHAHAGASSKTTSSNVMYCSVPHIRPPFCNLNDNQKYRGGYMRDLTFYLANLPSLPVPRLDVGIGTLYYRLIEAADLPSY